MKTGEKVHQELEKRKDSTSEGEKRKKVHWKSRKQEKKYIRELKNGKIVHQRAEKRKKDASEEPKTGEVVHENRRKSTSGA